MTSQTASAGPATTEAPKIGYLDAAAPLVQPRQFAKLLPELRRGGVQVVLSTVAAIEDSRYAMGVIGRWLHLERSGQAGLRMARTVAEIEKAAHDHEIAVVLHFQGCEPIEGDLQLLEVYHALGVRVMQLTYNARNRLGDGCLERDNAGLSRFGRQAVATMNQLGIVVDVAHVGERTSLEAIEHSASPVIATHANACGVYQSRRNLTDQQIRAIAASGGVIGTCAFPGFVGPGQPDLDRFLDHVDYMVQLVGAQHVGIGLDFAQETEEDYDYYGYEEDTYPRPPWTYPPGIAEFADVSNIGTGLRQRGYADEDIAAIGRGNFPQGLSRGLGPMSLRRVFAREAELRDGTRLVADITLPERGKSFPVVLVRTPYARVSDRIVGWADFFAASGYAFVAQDVRGRGDSGGTFEPWACEFDDGYDTIEWVAAQDWCNGRVGTLGGSYEGWTQWAAAARHPPALKAMVTSGSPGRWFRDWPYRYGAFYAADYFEWLARTSGRLVQPVPFPDWSFVVNHRQPRRLDADSGLPLARWQEALDHDTYDEYWHSLDITGYEEMDIAVLHVTGWWDACSPGEIHHFQELAARSPAGRRQQLVLGPFDHHGAVVTGSLPSGDLGIAAVGALSTESLWAGWFDRFLRGDDPAGVVSPAVRYFCLNANTWLEAEQWPPEGTRPTEWYLTGDGRLATGPEAGTTQRSYVYDPARPVLSLTSLHQRERLEWAPRPAMLVEHRPDVLMYRSAPVPSPITIAGPIEAALFVSSDAPDTDFVVSVVYVRADGTGTVLADGILRAAMRSSLERVELLEPGHVYELAIDVDDLSLRLEVGEAFAVVISSSLAPNYCPNPNTGEGYGGYAPGRPATQTIFHGGDTPSRISLHVLAEPGP
jgi:putative CocE/NonD family hydrolase